MGDEPVKLPTREEMLAAVLPVEWSSLARAGDRTFGPVVYRFATEADRDNFGKAGTRALAFRSK